MADRRATRPTRHTPPVQQARRARSGTAPTALSGPQGQALRPPASGIGFVDHGRPARANPTGLPDRLKASLEALSGLSLDAVRVHHNSAQPARIDAEAVASGLDIHLAPGQAHCLPHEAWHVVQQAQGRVQPDQAALQGLPLNADPSLEREADQMGALASQAVPAPTGHDPSRPPSTGVPP